MRQRNRKEMIKLIIFAILIIGALIIAIRFSQVERKAKERFAWYEAKAESVETSYGTITYIDE